MYKVVYFILLFCYTAGLFAYPINKQLLADMDRHIAVRGEYEIQKQQRINYLKQLSIAEQSPEKKYDLIHRIAEEYCNFQSDSAFVYIEKGRLLALANNNKEQFLENRFQYVFACAQSGLLNESESALKALDPMVREMSDVQKGFYYILYERLYMNLREFSENSHLYAVYAQKEKEYNDSILIYLNESYPLYYYHTFKKYFNQERYEDASAAMNQYLEHIDTVSNDAARAYFQVSLLYKQKSDRENEEKFLIKSVIADEQSAVRQNRSLRVLAELLYRQGEVRKAYEYIKISSADANFYNTKLRNSQIAEALPIIEKDYQLERDRQEFRLRFGFFLISILSIVILLISLYLRRKRRQLALARRELMKQNDDLNRINEEMKEKNEELNRLTLELRESDQIKEKYVGYFLKLCSDYIQKIDNYQKLAHRKIQTGQVEDLYKMVSSRNYLQKEARDFYNKFDEAFLQIYPNFVEDFNALLKEGQRFALKQGELLNTELRVFALIRMGIKESSQIAEFLGYTPVTIYSYRTKVKSRAIDKDNFEQQLMAIKR